MASPTITAAEAAEAGEAGEQDALDPDAVDPDAPDPDAPDPHTPEHVDVLIVGAGISGIGAACQLVRRRPGTTFAVLEARAALGGTWDLFRYPGVRSDSDMYTLGYSFRPWTSSQAIADGSAIRDYLRETARDVGVLDAVRLGHRVVAASWDSSSARWTVSVERAASGDGPPRLLEMTCRFLFAGTGYYRYDAGYTPHLPGLADFRGRVVHPQHWPADLDVSGQRVVVIGSGATAVTLVPAMAGTAAHVTMLQRSPSWVLALPSREAVDARLRRLPAALASPLIRWRHVLAAMALYELARRRPEQVKDWLRSRVRAQFAGHPELVAAADVDFAPDYAPWDQRLCFVPDGDLFAALRAGTASVVTDRVATFTETGITLASGRELPADVVVTATGLRLHLLGGIALSVDGAGVDAPGRAVYRGMMLAGVPNFAFALGYANASWTLKIDLVTAYVCRLLRHLDRTGTTTVTPAEPPYPEREPIIPLSSGYIQRGRDLIPAQGTRGPWHLPQNHLATLAVLRWSRVDGEGVSFTRPSRRPADVDGAAPSPLAAAGRDS